MFPNGFSLFLHTFNLEGFYSVESVIYLLFKRWRGEAKFKETRFSENMKK